MVMTLFSKLKQLLQHKPQNKDELIDLLRDAEARKLIDAATLSMIESAISITQLRVRDILLPRNQMISLKEGMTVQEIIDIITQSGHSRYPVYDASENDIIGILHAKDVLRYHQLNDDNFDMMDILRQAPFIPESKRLDNLLSEFRSKRNHMAIVVDEYGVVVGFVTIEDIIEQIIGDIEDEFDIDEEDYIKNHNDAFYIVKATTPIDMFNEQLNANFSDEQYDTIGGIVMTNFNYLPKRGERIVLQGFEFKIISADARRLKLLACVDRRHKIDEDDISTEHLKSDET